MRDHSSEENWIKPWEWRVEAADKSPRQRENGITSIVNLPRLSIPSIRQNPSSILASNNMWILDMLPRQLRERLPLHSFSGLLSSKSVLLGVGSIPNPVHEKIKDREQSEDDRVPAISVWVVVGEVKRAVTISEWDTRQVPEDKHKSPLLEIHIPSRNNQLLSLAASIGVEEVREDKEAHFLADVAVILVLSCGGGA